MQCCVYAPPVMLGEIISGGLVESDKPCARPGVDNPTCCGCRVPLGQSPNWQQAPRNVLFLVPWAS